MSGHNVALDPHHYVYVRGQQVAPYRPVALGRQELHEDQGRAEDSATNDQMDGRVTQGELFPLEIEVGDPVDYDQFDKEFRAAVAAGTWNEFGYTKSEWRARLKAIAEGKRVAPLISLLCLLLAVGCSSPLAPSSTSASAVIRTMDYLVPLKHPARTGAHEQSLWWDGRFLTNVKGRDPSHLEQWEFDGAMWRHVYDRTDSTGTAYRLLPGDWMPAMWRVGDTLKMLKSEIVRYDMRGKFLARDAFPYVMRFIACYDTYDFDGVVGSVPAIDVEYQPLQVNGQPHPHPNTETFRFAYGYGLVGWKAGWNGDRWLTFNEAMSTPVPPGFMVELPGR